LNRGNPLLQQQVFLVLPAFFLSFDLLPVGAGIASTTGEGLGSGAAAFTGGAAMGSTPRPDGCGLNWN
jgi:hypothetical protein